jgi:predicted anti-sigma-YlaC factor YlaD
MSHSTYRELMAAALDEPLAAADRAALEAHLQVCVACRAVWEALAEVDRLLVAAPVAPAPPAFVERVAVRLAARSSRPRLLGGGFILAVSAMIFLAVVLAPAAGLLALLLQQPGTLVALLRAVAAGIDVAGTVGGGLWLALTGLLDWSAAHPAAGLLALATLPLAALWIYSFNRLSAKAIRA